MFRRNTYLSDFFIFFQFATRSWPSIFLTGDSWTGGSLFLFNKRVLRFFRRDGHNWRKKKDGRTVQEAHERLKVCYTCKYLVHGCFLYFLSIQLMGEIDSIFILVLVFDLAYHLFIYPDMCFSCFMVCLRLCYTDMKGLLTHQFQCIIKFLTICLFWRSVIFNFATWLLYCSEYYSTFYSTIFLFG